MKRDAAKKAMPYLFDKWIKASKHEKTPQEQLSSTEFLSWLRENHPEYLEFRSDAGPTYDIDLWFDQYFKQAWSR